ncbi:MAG: hypothetical protein WBW01_14285, partial [Terriglobales bacterium]
MEATKSYPSAPEANDPASGGAEENIAPRRFQIRDRIRELRRVPASALVRNPKNWRRHPKL